MILIIDIYYPLSADIGGPCKKSTNHEVPDSKLPTANENAPNTHSINVPRINGVIKILYCYFSDNNKF